MIEETTAHKVVSDKLKDIDSLKRFSYPTPEERRAVIDKQNKEKSVKENEMIEDPLASQEELDEISLNNGGNGKNRLKGFTADHVKRFALDNGWVAVGGGSHDNFKHPKHPNPLSIPRHRGDLSRPLVKKLQSQILLQDLKESVISFSEFILQEAVDVNNFNTYSAAVQHALKTLDKGKFTYNDDEYHSIVAGGSKKPSVGKTTSWKLPLIKDGKEIKKMLVVNVYGKENGKYELNHYIS